MTVLEQRKHRRYPLLHGRSENSGCAHDGDVSIEVISDISSSGIRFYLNTTWPRACRSHRVRRTQPQARGEWNGGVVRTRVHGTDDGDLRGRFIIGVQLLSPMLLMAMSGTY